MVALGELIAPDLNAIPVLEASDPRLLERAGKQGRVRDAVLVGLGAVRANPHRAGAVLQDHFRAATWLHSAERRFASDAVRDILRWESLLDALVEDPGADEARFRRWLVAKGAEAIETDRPVAAALPDFETSAARFANLPPSMVAAVGRVYGHETAAVLLGLQGRAPVCLRVNARLAQRNEAAQRLASEGVDTVEGAWSPMSLIVVGRSAIEQTQTWKSGWIEVQDAASQCVVDATPRGTVLDLCAGGGGKSLALAARGDRVIASDSRPMALRELQRRAQRAGLAIEVVALDGLPRHVDVLLIDAPCTGMGTLRRHPELRLSWDDQTIPRHASQQRRLLRDALKRVSADVVVWATCSLLVEENEAVWTEEAPTWTGNWTRMDPAHHSTDGFCWGVFSRLDDAGVAAPAP